VLHQQRGYDDQAGVDDRADQEERDEAPVLPVRRYVEPPTDLVAPAARPSVRRRSLR
jgi:hypothetical protein